MDQSDRDRGHRPLAFDKMEGLVREMQDAETGVPVRSQKLFLTSIPSAFMGYDLIEWFMERLNIEESVEAVHIANQFCQYGYFFPVSDSKNLVVKDDSSYYRFQTPYYWPWQHRSPDNVEYAIYLVKRTLRNKQRHGLEEYEIEFLNSLKKTLQNRWDFITLQAEEQVRLAKDRKKGDKIVSDSQERAYWRVYRTPPGYLNCLEPSPVPNRTRGASRLKKRTQEDLKREVDFLRNCLVRTRVKVSQALENLVQYSETYTEYDPFMTPAQPSNPWVTEDPAFWQLNGPLVEVLTEKRVKRWSLSMEELVTDPTGLQEFTNYLRKEYSHENIRYWTAVNDLRRSAQSQIQHKVKEIFDEFLAPGAPCEVNIDCKTMEKVHVELRNPSRFTFDSAAEHVYTLLLKKDCYPRFIRSEHYKNLLANGIQPLQKKRFFGFGGPAKKKSSTTNAPNSSGLLQQQMGQSLQSHVGTGQLARRRGSERSLTGSVHELAVSGIREVTARVSHSHSQSNLSDIPYRGDLPSQSQASSILWSSLDPPGGTSSAEGSFSVPDKPVAPSDVPKDDNVCPWDAADTGSDTEAKTRPPPDVEPLATTSAAIEEVLPVKTSRKNSSQLDSAGSSSSDISVAIAEVSNRLRKTCLMQQDSLTNTSTENRNVRSTSEERVIARIQTVRKYSTVSITRPTSDSRRSSITANLPDSNRPSVSSSEELVLATPQCSTDHVPAVQANISDKNNKSDLETCPKTNRKSSSGRKKSASSAPLISVSSVVDDAFESTSETLCVDEAGKTKSDAEATSSDTDHKASDDVCPWEDEENCKVDTPFVKTYATLGYL